jgi:hypothetical protein
MVVPPVVRLLIAAWILVTLARAARGAWAHRRLMVTVWRSVRPRHLGGTALLLLLVAATMTMLIALVPGMTYGLGTLVGTTSNAVFAPLEAAVAASGPAPTSGPDWVLLVSGTVFLLPLAVLLPWLAFVEEEVFRAGIEDASLPRELLAALVFGLAHLIMLVPIGAAVAIGVAGFVYGRVYRRAYASADPDEVPRSVIASYRTTKRSAAAADRSRTPAVLLDGAVVTRDTTPERRQAAAVLASTVWHTTFNTTVVLLVWLTLMSSAMNPTG